MNLPLSLEILKQACEKYGYQFELIDEFSGYLAKVSDGKRSFFGGMNYPFNSASAVGVAKDKAFTKMLLTKNDFHVPRGDYFFVRKEDQDLRPVGKEMEEAIKFANNFGYPVFVKPNDRTKGHCCKITSDEVELKNHFQKIAKYSEMAIIEEVITGKKEYRIFVIDGEVQFLHERKNFVNGKKVFADSEQTTVDYRETVNPKITQWIKKLANTMQLRVFGVDLFAEDVEDPDTFTILEINSCPSLQRIWKLGKKEKAIEIWGKIFKQIF